MQEKLEDTKGVIRSCRLKKNWQCNGQKKKRTDNAMVKRKKELTMQWSKEKKNWQCNGQKKKRTDNTMVKRKKKNNDIQNTIHKARCVGQHELHKITLAAQEE